MKTNFVKRTFALLLVCMLCLGMAACGEEVVEETDDTSDYIYAQAGGTITLPEELVISQEAETITTMLTENSLVGGFTLTKYNTTGYFTQNGSLTLNVNASLTNRRTGEAAKTKWTDCTAALWKRGQNEAEFVGTVHFSADGTNQTYTFSGLEAGAQYRVAFTYSQVANYLMTGTFSIDGVAGQSADDQKTTDAE